MLFDLTNQVGLRHCWGTNCLPISPSCCQESFHSLRPLLEQAQRLSPAAMRAVVGTKADLQVERAVATSDALVSHF